MIEEEKITLPLAHVKEWQQIAQDAINPKVDFNLNSTIMMQDAYEKRGEALLLISSQIKGWTG
jgi:hypothetical protein